MRLSLCVGLVLILAVLGTNLGVISAQSFPPIRLATLEGLVATFDDFGELVALPWVRMNVTSSHLNNTVYSDGKGHYVMYLTPGSYNLTAYLSGYSLGASNISLKPGQILIVNFHLLRMQTAPRH